MSAVLSKDDEVWDKLAATSTEDPFRQHPALAYRVTIGTDAMTADVLVATLNGRVGIAWGGDASWRDLRDACDLTTETGGDAFAIELRAAINDWLNDPDAWDARG